MAGGVRAGGLNSPQKPTNLTRAKTADISGQKGEASCCGQFRCKPKLPHATMAAKEDREEDREVERPSNGIPLSAEKVMKERLNVPLAARFLQLVFEHQDLLLEGQLLALGVSQLFAQSLQLRAVLSLPARQLLLVQQRLLLQVSTQAPHLLSLVHGGRCSGGAGLLHLGGGKMRGQRAAVWTCCLQSQVLAELPSAAPAPPPAGGCTARSAPSSSSPSESLLTAPPPGIPSDDGSEQKIPLLDVND